jgi:pyruvate/2-oxoglutarate dehydrogenase complex dihydrolipoamide acyltransferase (E2) component
MRFAFYCGVLLVAAASVVFGLDWMSAPMPPMPDVKNVVFVPPPPPPPPRVVQTPAVAPSPPPNSARPPVAASDPAAASAPAVNTPPPSVEVAPAPQAVTAPRPKCDIPACEAAYRSFRESDCTYNPNFGPRRLCTKGDPEKYARDHPEPVMPAPAATPAAEAGSIVAPEPGAVAAPEPAASSPPRCNVSACAAAYPRSFRESDCTFNPSVGSRKVCEK